MKKIINSEKAPKAIGPYSQAVLAGDLLFISGQIPLNPATMEVSGETAGEQADQVLKNIGSILNEAGLSYDNIVKTTILLADISDFKEVNEVYAKYFTKNFPARATYAVKALPLGVKIEIESIASLS